MKITNIGDLKTIMSNPNSKHNYFAWPTIARLQNGKLAVVASGYRLRHICPFGKMVISYSENDGETYTVPAPVIDTFLDDRDGGILPFGENGVIVTSFNNTLKFQRDLTDLPYDLGYLDLISPQEEESVLGACFRFSFDCGTTFGEIHKSPVTSPHGPLELPDGSLLWIGRAFSPDDSQQLGKDRIEAHRINLDGSTQYVGHIDNIEIDGLHPLSCEPHAILLPDGKILVHIRVQEYPHSIFTIYQAISEDMGKSWSKPEPILPQIGGAPPHLLMHSSGTLICTYGFREKPFGIKVMFSEDNGKTWDTDHYLYHNDVSLDLGYPSSIELSDGSLLTVFYARLKDDEPAVILQQKWSFEK